MKEKLNNLLRVCFTLNEPDEPINLNIKEVVGGIIASGLLGGSIWSLWILLHAIMAN